MLIVDINMTKPVDKQPPQRVLCWAALLRTDVNVMMMVADVLAPNRRQAIRNHRADSIVTAASYKSHHESYKLRCSQ